MTNYSIKFLFLMVVLAQTAIFAQKPADTLENLFKTRQYFDLRDTLAKQKADDSPEQLFYRGVVANRFNELEESASLLRSFAQKAGKDAPHLTDAYEILADNYAKEFAYGQAADAYKFLLDNFRTRLDSAKIKDYENMFGLWNALREVPRQTVSLNGDSNIQGTRDIAKLLNIPVEVGATKMDFVFDTGANISTMSVSTAQKLGLKLIESDVSVGSSTDIKVKSKLTFAPNIKIGNATVHNVVFLVLEDSALSFPQANYQIHAIIGFPVMQSLGKISIAKNNQVSIVAKSAAQTGEQNMCLEGLLPLVAAHYQNKRLTFAFDTGAVTTDFYLPFFKANEAEITKTVAPQKVKVGGAGGMKEIMSYSLKDLELTIGGKSVRLSKARVLTEITNEDSNYFYGNLGQDLINQFERMTLDFRAMRIDFQ